MRRSTKRKLNNAGIASCVLGCVVLGVFGLKVLTDSKVEPTTDTEAFTPYSTSAAPPIGATPAPSDGDSAPSDGKHKVRITVESDGKVKVGFKFIDGDQGIKDANRSFSLNKTVQGDAALAQVGVELGTGATYATCTISVDGVKKSTRRTTATAQVVICNA